MPFKDRKHPERYDRNGGTDDEDHYESILQKTAKNQVRPSMFAKRQTGLTGADLDKLKGLSKEEQIRKMSNLAHKFSFE